jgi:protease PrsW
LAFIISILPIFIYLSVLIFFDSFSIIRAGRLCLTFLWGMVVCFGLYLLAPYVPHEIDIFPLLEEILKFSIIVYLLYKNKFAFFSDAAIYGAAVGAGFALVENFLYVYSLEGMSFGDVVYRGLATSFLHIGMTAMASVLLLLISKGASDSGYGRNLILFSPVAIIPSVVFHYLHNAFLLPPVISLFTVIVVIAALFMVMFYFNERQIHKWLELSVYNEVQLASAISKGEFSQTEAGKYLLSVKEQFKREVFFDMLVYVRLYLDISLLSKRNIMLKEAGMEIPDDENEQIRDEIREFKQLRHNIGKIGVYTLSPIINTKDIDKWIDIFIFVENK